MTRDKGRSEEEVAETAGGQASRHPGAVFETLATDEHRIGLKPITRRVWAPGPGAARQATGRISPPPLRMPLCHRPGRAVPERIRRVSLPPYTPELQPAETLWVLVDAPIGNRDFDTLSETAVTAAAQCIAPYTDPN